MLDPSFFDTVIVSQTSYIPMVGGDIAEEKYSPE